MRERDFGDEDCFDSKAVTCLEVGGYVPIREEKGKDRVGESYYYSRHTRGEIRFESCMSVIQYILRDCFRLEAEVNAVKISSEHWSIPIRPLEV